MAITRSVEELRKLRQKVKETRSEGRRKYNERANKPEAIASEVPFFLEDKILLDTCKAEQKLATKVTRENLFRA